MLAKKRKDRQFKKPKSHLLKAAFRFKSDVYPVSHLLLKLKCRVVVTTVKIRRKLIDYVTQLLPQRFLTGLLFNFWAFRFKLVNREC
jgi:hypothetical protein